MKLINFNINYMKELNEVCNKFLDNADLIISKNNSVDIEFIFYVY
jgi:hypothetical protein